MERKYMTVIMRLFCLMSLVLMTPLFAEIERVPIEDRVYGIVRGENVPARILPDDKARINTKLKNYEFVAVTKIGEGKEKSWIKIYNIPGKEGWVKKDNVEIVDENNRDFMEILNNQCRIGRMLNSTSYDKDRFLYKIGRIDDFYYVSYRTQDKTGIQLTVDFVRVYKRIDGSFHEVAMDNIQNGNIYIEENRMFLYGSQLIVVNDISQYVNSKLKSDKYRYKGVASLSLNITKYLDSYMEFDPKTKIVTQYLRIKENQPYVIEKYQFKDDEFVQIGGRQHEM